jgi:hypothetical protein
VINFRNTIGNVYLARLAGVLAGGLVVIAATAVVLIHGQASAQPASVVGVITDAGDVNGDGRDDLVTFVRSTGEVLVRASDGRAAFRASERWLTAASLVDSATEKQSYQVMGDFNGDGRSDIAHFVRRTVGDVYVALSRGTSFAAPVRVHDNFGYGSEVPAVGDVNGDGYDDLVTFTRGGAGDVYVLLSGGDGRTFRVGGVGRVWHDNFAYGSEAPLLGDVNGDGYDDIVTYRHHDISRVFVALSDGRSFYRSGSNQAAVWLPRLTNNESAEPAVAIADINRDGRGDLVAAATPRLVWVKLSNGSAFSETTFVIVDDAAVIEIDDTIGLGDFDGNGSTDVVSLKRATGDVRVATTTVPRNADLRSHCTETVVGGASHWRCPVLSTYLWATGFARYGPGEGPLARDASTAPDNRWLGDSRTVMVGN